MNCLFIPRGSIALRAPRSHLCLPLPAGFTPPETEAARRRLSSAMADGCGVSSVTALFSSPRPNVWVCAFLHGASRRKRAATYEQGRPGSITYIPRDAELVIADGVCGRLYLSGPSRSTVFDWLPALNGTLFPDRRPAEPFTFRPFQLAPLRFLSVSARRPTYSSAPWAALALKGISWQEAGSPTSLSMRLWCGDGFEELDVTGEPWPPHLLSVAFSMTPVSARHAYTAELYEGRCPMLRATLSLATFEAVGALTSLAWSTP